jgi:hypothetical protein
MYVFLFLFKSSPSNIIIRFTFLRFCRKGEVRMVFTVLYLLVVGTRIKLETTYRGADKTLARPGRKQPTATEDFDFHISYL